MSLLDCQEWAGCRNEHGYGGVNRQGRTWLAHRWAWTQANGPIPAGLQVLHRCDNPPCVNLDHLFLGTQLDNIADMVAKGRHSPETHRGEGNGRARLRAADIPVIRARLARGDKKLTVARAYGVGWTTVDHIAKGHTWAQT